MKTIAFLNNKGGVGKTASVTTLAHIVSRIHNKKVLVVDSDPQGNTSNLFSDIDFLSIFNSILTGNTEKKELSLEDVLMDLSLDVHTCIKKTAYENLDVLPALLTLSEVEERLKTDIKTPQQFKLKAALNQVADEYDYCFIDCSPSVSLLNVNALVASDEVYIPTRCDGGSILGIPITMNLINTVSSYNQKLKLGGIFFTQFQGRKNVAKEVFNFLDAYLPEGILLPITISTTKLMEEGSLQQIPLLARDSGKKKSKATLEYMALAEYIIAPNKKVFLKALTKKDGE